ncbi:guard cell S-type anion channel SLAC1-like [Chenopodium quinoa]|uniref:guard cell S-type anion channel SLAC1-like n=1 Tax=Chenopodium quinoa TaxID=63459 RepID=UPI000B779FE2|nr:guard cell S-type anion channel SLAC1-like [Chenopodium quinoa]
MDKTPPDPRPSNAHLIDIQEVLSEEDEGTTLNRTTAQKPEKRGRARPVRHQEPARRAGNRSSLSRQVSLETGFSVLKGTQQNERVALSRSGRSLGGLGAKSSGAVVREVKKGDFSMFKTKSSLTKQNSLMPMKKECTNEVDYNQKIKVSADDSVPAGRYFAALRGPELDQVKDYDDILLPRDETWPFLLRFPIGCFGICLGLSSQSILWKSLSISPAMKFLKVTPFINLVLWILALLILVLVCTTYLLKCIFYFEAIKREYFHPVRVNFFFAPWIVAMFMAIGVPPRIAPNTLHPAVFCVFAIPTFILELKIYGQWLSGGRRRLSMVANPSSHLSVIGNFVGAILGARVGWKGPAKFLWAVGFAHYLVVFVTLYQRLPTSETLPKELHPVYCMFIATPAAASIAWEAIYGEFDGLSRTCFFIALFLYISLVVRPTFFTGFRFSMSWWSYTFPMTTASIATIKYAEQAPSIGSKGLALSLPFMSSTMVAILFVSTILHGFVWQTLFPNDLAIAIAKRKQGKEHNKKPKKANGIRRWTKQSPLSLVSAMTKNNS